MRDKIYCVKAFILFLLFSFAQNGLFAVPQYEIDFIKGNIAQKTQAVVDADDSGDISFGVKALDFALSAHDTLGDDPDLVILVQTAIQSVGTDPQKGQAPGLSEKLAQVFKTFKSESIRIAALDRIALFPSADSVALINNYVSESARNHDPMSSVLLKAITSLGKIGNSNSFTILFAIDLIGVWPTYTPQIEAALGPLANASEKDLLNIYSSSPIDQKLMILKIISNNDKISQNIKGEVAENALSNAISIAKGNTTISGDQINLQLQAIQTLADTHWTRATLLVTSYFPIAQGEYESRLLTADQFAQVITNTAKVASSDTGTLLSSYLDSLNKAMEKGLVPAKQVILAVINSLGSLGDKTAFDYLLYVTYLDYPEDVTAAARNALAMLKW
jgi:hypothetical protein